MKTTSFIASVLYSSAQITFGLLVHPYQTMQSLVKERVFVWMAALPLFLLMGVTVLWRGAVVPMVQLFFSCSAAPIVCDVVSFVSNTVVFFCWYWQVLLLYLLIRFRLLLRNG